MTTPKTVKTVIDSKVQAIVNAMIKRIAESAASADSRSEVWYMPISDISELHTTLSFKPSSAGMFEVVRNNKAIVVNHSDIKPTDSIVMKATFEVFAYTTLTIHKTKELVRVIANVEYAIDLASGAILAMARNKESKVIDLSPTMRFNGTQFANVKEVDLLSALTLYTAKFVNKVTNNTPADSKKREYLTRDNTAESNMTLYGRYRAAQTAKREAKKLADAALAA